MKLYLDIHSHTSSSDPEVLTIENLYQDFSLAEARGFCSVGMHPWYLDHFPAQMGQVEEIAKLPKVVAIGECGLDKKCETPMALQMEAFAWQIDLANQLGKPLIIHCVRAYAEAIQMLKKAIVPVVFHGFQKNAALAQELLDQGFYLSFDAALTQNKKNAIDSFSVVPFDRFFLETDDSDMPIQQIYKASALIRGLDEEELIAQIHRNYQTVFKK